MLYVTVFQSIDLIGLNHVAVRFPRLGEGFYFYSIPGVGRRIQ
jgi:hypothetical protein